MQLAAPCAAADRQADGRTKTTWSSRRRATAERRTAMIEVATLRDDLLSESHPVGQFESAFLRGLGS
jgi:hypothetical protein